MAAQPPSPQKTSPNFYHLIFAIQCFKLLKIFTSVVYFDHVYFDQEMVTKQPICWLKYAILLLFAALYSKGFYLLVFLLDGQILNFTDWIWSKYCFLNSAVLQDRKTVKNKQFQSMTGTRAGMQNSCLRLYFNFYLEK